MSNQKLTRKGARALTAMMDQVATTIMENAAVLGIDPKIAHDYAYRTDFISDAVEKKAGANFPLPKGAGFDAGSIGAKKPGPLETLNSDEPWMNGEYTQEEFRELAQKQESGALSDGIADGNKTASSELRARVARLERVLIRLAEEEGDEKDDDTDEVEVVEEEEEVVESSKKASSLNLFA